MKIREIVKSSKAPSSLDLWLDGGTLNILVVMGGKP